jgi:hypothetical protein
MSHIPSHFSSKSEVIFWPDWYLNKGLEKQALYRLSHTSSPFCSGYFGDGVTFAWDGIKL